MKFLIVGDPLVKRRSRSLSILAGRCMREWENFLRFFRKCRRVHPKVYLTLYPISKTKPRWLFQLEFKSKVLTFVLFLLVDKFHLVREALVNHLLLLIVNPLLL